VQSILKLKALLIFGYMDCSRSLNRSRILNFKKFSDPEPDSKILEWERNRKSDCGHFRYKVDIRDERTVKFFSPSPVLIR